MVAFAHADPSGAYTLYLVLTLVALFAYILLDSVEVEVVRRPADGGDA